MKPEVNIIQKYIKFCESKGIKFELNDKVNPYDDTTLFCPCGMQKYKSQFKDINYFDTISNVQSCIRMNDFDEVGDGTHLLYFNMIGLFSFRKMSIQDTVDFWMEFLLVELGLNISYVTIHPDKEDWRNLYSKYTDLDIVITDECLWSDGEIGGYCTEFFIDGVEIGNIVNPLGDCIDVGFGLERLEMFVNGKLYSKEDILKKSVEKIIDSGYMPSNLRQGYVLRKILREIYKCGFTFENDVFYSEIERQNKIKKRYESLKDKNSDKDSKWWFETHGINIDDFI